MGMKAERLEPNVITYTAASNACEKALQWEPTLLLLEDMKRDGVQLTSASCNAVITSCASAEQWAIALEVLRMVRTVGVKPSAAACGAAVKACERGEHWQTATEMLEWMKKENLEVELNPAPNGGEGDDTRGDADSVSAPVAAKSGGADAIRNLGGAGRGKEP